MADNLGRREHYHKDDEPKFKLPGNHLNPGQFGDIKWHK